jgi:hypothetical protein
MGSDEWILLVCVGEWVNGHKASKNSRQKRSGRAIISSARMKGPKGKIKRKKKNKGGRGKRKEEGNFRPRAFFFSLGVGRGRLILVGLLHALD